MKRNDLKIRKKKHWAVGITLAALGVLVHRVLSPETGSAEAVVQIVGITLAIAGLFVLSAGVRAGMKEDEDPPV